MLLESLYRRREEEEVSNFKIRFTCFGACILLGLLSACASGRGPWAVRTAVNTNAIFMESMKTRRVRDELVEKFPTKKMADVVRVVFKKNGVESMEFPKAEVYKAPDGSYVVFGETKNLYERNISHPTQQSIQAEMQAMMKDMQMDVNVTDFTIEPSDIETLMAQTKYSRDEAVEALENAKGDLITAIVRSTGR